jgi:beta-1,4-mannosyltransferase
VITAERTDATASSALSSGAHSAGLRISMLPFYQDNPYQREFVSELRQLGIEVDTRSRLKGLISDIWRGRCNPQVIHLHWLPAMERRWIGLFRLTMFFFRLVLLRLSGRQLVWTVHNLYGHEGHFRAIQRLFSRGIIYCASSVIVHSPSAVELVATEFKVKDRRKLRVIPHGNYIQSYPNEISRIEARHQLGFADLNAPVVLFLGKIRPYKGVPELIRAFHELDHPRARLVVAGAPLNDAVWHEVTEAAGGSTRVRLDRGYVSSDRIQLYLNAADVVVFPYQDVLTSGAVILAMSFGKPCVAARLGCIGDTLDENGGYLYDASDPLSLRTALAQALNNPHRLETLGRHNYIRASAWSWRGIARETVKLYFPDQGESLS